MEGRIPCFLNQFSFLLCFIFFFAIHTLTCACTHRCELLIHILSEDENFKSVWQAALNWLQAEMDRVSLLSLLSRKTSKMADQANWMIGFINFRDWGFGYNIVLAEVLTDNYMQRFARKLCM